MLITNHNIFLNHAKSQNRVNHKSEIKNSSIYTHASQIKRQHTESDTHLHTCISNKRKYTSDTYFARKPFVIDIISLCMGQSLKRLSCNEELTYHTTATMQSRSKMTNNYYYSHMKIKNDNKHYKQWYKTLEPGKEPHTIDIKAK